MISERHRGPDLRGEQAEPREELRVGCPVTGQSRVYTQGGHAPPPEAVEGEKRIFRADNGAEFTAAGK